MLVPIETYITLSFQGGEPVHPIWICACYTLLHVSGGLLVLNQNISCGNLFNEDYLSMVL